MAMSSPKNQYLIVRYDRPHAHDTEESLSDRRLPEYDSLVQAVNIRLESLGIPWRIKSWQAAVAAECLAGHDVVVKAQTGSGKSMCYYSLAMLHPKDCILVICPLLALMADQVSSAGALGIKAVQLSAATMKEDPNLLNKVRGGEFSIVFVAAEFTAGEGWRSLILDDRTGRKPNFAQSLRRIIIDEAHLVREWRVFRPHYRNLGLLRTRFPRVPIMACSATLPKATLAYIHKSLHLERPTVLCDMPTDRPNITLFTAPIPKGQLHSMTPLLDLVPKEALSWNPEFFGDGDADWNPCNIPKTLVFIDDKNACCTLTTQLINQFPEPLRRSDARDIISEYHSTMSRKALERNLQALRDGTCRIMVCTDAVGMGLDVPDIQRILQWRVPPWLTVSGWMQRAGRAARNPEIGGIATIYYDPSCTVEAGSPFLGRAQVEEELEAVHTAIKACTPEDAEDIEIRPKKKRGSLPCEAELLWYINTKGCIREVAMHYLGSKPEPRAAFDEHEQGSPCCCRCYKESGNAPDDFAGFSVRTCTPFVGSDADPELTADTIGGADGDAEATWDDTQPANYDDSQSIAKVSPVSKSRIRLAVRLALDIWRHQELSKQQAADRMLRAKHVLSDSMIAKLEAKCLVVKQAVDVTSAISGPNRDVLRYTRIANNTAELAELIVQVVSSATAPDLPPRARNAPFTPGEPKPMFSENDIDGASNPKVTQMMRNANQELRQFDIVSVNAKETARLKRNASTQLKRLIFGGSQPAGSIVSATESDAESIAHSVFSQNVPNSQQTDRDLMPPPSLPVKRGRGRPRKTPLMEPSVASTASDASDGPPRKKFTRQVSPDEAQIPPESESLNEEPIKRGRGRPRGSKNRRPSSPARSPAEEPIKRGRGRPRGSQNPPEQQSPSHSNDRQPEQSDAPDDKDAAMET